VKDTGLSLGFLADLALKVLYFEGYMSGLEIAQALALPFAGVIEQVLLFLKRERFCEVKGSTGAQESSYQYAITERGSEKAREILERGQYVGPAPVTLEAYTQAIRQQSIRDTVVSPDKLQRAFSHLVLDPVTLSQIGPAINSGRSIFLFGPPGNGKTSIAEAIGQLLLEGTIFIPYAIEIDGQLVRVFDNVNHRRVETNAERYDARWVHIHRPVIMVAGELTLENLDLIYHEVSMYYEAPFHMKANGGMFLIDDFGRQQVKPQDLLNRWIMPLEKRVDYLTLHTGRKIEIPFDVLIVFSTNLEPEELVDEAFLRRIRHKIEIKDPTYDQYREIFRRVCKAAGVPYSDQALAYLLQEYYIKPGLPLRACHPRDLIEHLVSIARYTGREPALTKELIDLAWRSYFVRGQAPQRSVPKR